MNVSKSRRDGRGSTSKSPRTANVFSMYVLTRRSIVVAIEEARSVSRSSLRCSTWRALKNAASAVATSRPRMTAAAVADGRKARMRRD
jgi:hypothetical protein